MTQQIEVGSIITGKITGVQPYGAFVSINETTQGLVHISEITHGFVKEINDYVKVGDEVTVKVLSIDSESGKVGLSIRATKEASEQPIKSTSRERQQSIIKQLDNEDGFNTLKEKLQEWIDQSELKDTIKK